MKASTKDARARAALGRHLRTVDPTLQFRVPPAADPAHDSVESARAAGLRYVRDTTKGYARKKSGATFIFVDASGARIRDGETIARIKALAIPPAWTHVWICPDTRGHLQATGRDARGRKQYRYHADYRRVRDETKFGRMAEFAVALPKIRRRVAHDLRAPGLPREKVLATIVRLLDTTFIRIGNDEYAKENGSYGLTTMRDKHAKITRGSVEFEFVGKSGKAHKIKVDDPKLARIVKACRDIPGYDLFQYYDDAGERRTAGSSDVNDYLREIAGSDFTAKDFRTWGGTVLAACALRQIGIATTEPEAKRNVVEAVEAVAKLLGNTPAVCRSSYVHPGVLDAYAGGIVLEANVSPPVPARAARPSTTLRADERAVLAMLKKLQRKAARPRNSKARAAA